MSQKINQSDGFTQNKVQTKNVNHITEHINTNNIHDKISQFRFATSCAIFFEIQCQKMKYSANSIDYKIHFQQKIIQKTQTFTSDKNCWLFSRFSIKIMRTHMTA